MAKISEVGLADLLPDIACIIFSYTDKETMLRVRCVNRHLSSLATKVAFRQIKLLALKDGNSHTSFINIARSENLRGLVREVVCDTSLWPNHPGNGSHNDKVPVDFLMALPSLRHFRSITSFELQFHHPVGYDGETQSAHTWESEQLRYRILETIFQCLAGTWSPEHQKEVDDSLDFPRKFGFDAEYDSETLSARIADAVPVRLRRLSMQTSHVFPTNRLTNSVAFRTVISASSLVELDIDFALETYFQFPRRVNYASSFLPLNWLSTRITENLVVLKLDSMTEWGWCPRANLQTIQLPNLKKLLLGQYVFSHQSEIDWVASLGKNNASGGLEELELKFCTILYHAHHLSRLQANTVQNPCQHGENIVSQIGFDRDFVAKLSREGPGRYYSNFPLRWHIVLDQWRRRIPGLKAFQIFSSQDSQEWDDIDPGVKWRSVYTWCTQRHHMDWSPPALHPSLGTAHCPENAAQLGSDCLERDESALGLLMDMVKARREGQQPEQDMASGPSMAEDRIGAQLYRVNGDKHDPSYMIM